MDAASDPAGATPDAGTLIVRPLVPARVDDFLHFFDHERGAAFADNPQWAKCYCHFYEVPAVLDWTTFDAAANRTAMRARIEVGEMEGFLAYAGAEVVGWINAQPLHKLPHCWGRLGVERPALDLPAHEAAAIVCFVIAPAWRRRGVARALLDGALAALAARGVRRVFAFPFDAGDATAATAHYHGPAAIFRDAGFTAIDRAEDLTVTTRALTSGAAEA